jgi:hypothetical protein
VILGYIDPGAGSLLIQAIIAGLVSVPFFFRNTIRNAVRRIKGEPATVSTDDVAQADAEQE